MKHHACEKDSIQNPSTCTSENRKYLESVIGDSVITCDEIIEMTRNIPAKAASTKTVKTKTISKKTIPAKIIAANFNK